jgi:DNA helicase-2/ATP-dependent DNA helicase PcrA
VVADPDQAIYEFRQAEPSSYLNYRQGLPEDAIVYLDENWRSSPAICALASSLRSISTRPILSRRDPTGSPHADVVYVAAGTHEHARSHFDRLATDLGIDAGERLVLAATRRAASALSGRAPNAGAGSTLTSQIMSSVATLRYSRDASGRKAALSTIEGILLGSIKFPDDLQRARRQEQLDAAGFDQLQLRMMAAHLVTESESWTDLGVAVNSIRESVRTSLRGSTIEHVPTGQRFKSVKNSNWRAWTRAGQAPRQSLDIAGAHIHSVKGGERDAVLLDIEDEPIGPRPHVVQLWAARETHEARRVLYVGASRARRLLVLAVPPRHLEALREVLERSAVPTEFLVERT